MARSFGRFTTSIWRDPDFTSLTLEQQGAYFTLGLQPDVTAAGLLPLTARRWAKLSAGTTRDDFETLIDKLATHDGRHLIVDEDSEELLIRKFVKWDMGWANSKRLPVVVEAIKTIQSIHIRDIAVEELRRITEWHMASPAQQEAVKAAVSTFDRVVVTEVENIPQPLTAIHESEPVEDDPLSDFCIDHQPNGALGPCQRCAIRRTANQARRKAALEIEVEAKRTAVQARKACDLCDDRGWRLHPKSRQPLGRCNHEALEVGAS